MNKCEHEFTHATEQHGKYNNTVIIYCKKCGTSKRSNN